MDSNCTFHCDEYRWLLRVWVANLLVHETKIDQTIQTSDFLPPSYRAFRKDLGGGVMLRGGSRLVCGGVSVSRSHMSSTYEPGGGGGGGRHMCPFTYVRVNVGWLLILQSLRLR